MHTPGRQESLNPSLLDTANKLFSFFLLKININVMNVIANFGTIRYYQGTLFSRHIVVLVSSYILRRPQKFDKNSLWIGTLLGKDQSN